MHPDLVLLLELQTKDLSLLEADQALGAILAELQGLESQIGDAVLAADKADRALTDAKRRRTESEDKVENFRKLVERGRAHLDKVKTPKEAAAVNIELDIAGSSLAREEADWQKLADLVSGLEVTARETAERVATLRDGQQTERTEIVGRQKAATKVRAAALAERDKLAGGINKPLRTRYERLRSVRFSNMVVALNGPACGSCFTAVPLNRRSQIRAGTLIDSCESCGVIIYAAETVEVVE
ncbi:MAG: hypothetical protein ABI587_16605 [Gemmatimonadales bacterium]